MIASRNTRQRSVCDGGSTSPVSRWIFLVLVWWQHLAAAISSSSIAILSLQQLSACRLTVLERVSGLSCLPQRHSFDVHRAVSRLDCRGV